MRARLILFCRLSSGSCRSFLPGSHDVFCPLRRRTRIGQKNARSESGNARVGPTTTPTRASEARVILRSPDPVERLAWDAVLPEKEAQLGRMFLHVAHSVQLELEIADRTFPVPGE